VGAAVPQDRPAVAGPVAAGQPRRRSSGGAHGGSAESRRCGTRPEMGGAPAMGAPARQSEWCSGLARGGTTHTPQHTGGAGRGAAILRPELDDGAPAAGAPTRPPAGCPGWTGGGATHPPGMVGASSCGAAMKRPERGGAPAVCAPVRPPAGCNGQAGGGAIHDSPGHTGDALWGVASTPGTTGSSTRCHATPVLEHLVVGAGDPAGPASGPALLPFCSLTEKDEPNSTHHHTACRRGEEGDTFCDICRCYS